MFGGIASFVSWGVVLPCILCSNFIMSAYGFYTKQSSGKLLQRKHMLYLTRHKSWRNQVNQRWSNMKKGVNIWFLTSNCLKKPEIIELVTIEAVHQCIDLILILIFWSWPNWNWRSASEDSFIVRCGRDQLRCWVSLHAVESRLNLFIYT